MIMLLRLLVEHLLIDCAYQQNIIHLQVLIFQVLLYFAFFFLLNFIFNSSRLSNNLSISSGLSAISKAASICAISKLICSLSSSLETFTGLNTSCSGAT